MSRQNIYLLATSLFLLIFIVAFSFLVLIPKGKLYRINKGETHKISLEQKQLQEHYDLVSAELNKLTQENTHIINAYANEFTTKAFYEQNQKYFNSLNISEVKESGIEEGFSVYEVNTISNINSPQNFYEFLDAINKSDWIISVNFPIEFKREDNNIKSSFTMKVYNNAKESNSTVIE